MIALYKQIRGTIQTGDLYRLRSPRTENLSATQYVSTDGKQSVLFAFLHSQQYMNPMPVVYLQGLDPKATYKVRTIDNKLADRLTAVSGGYLMNKGLSFNLSGDFDATAVVLERVEP